jgi:putative polyhydroxyalkanoate system protein
MADVEISREHGMTLAQAKKIAQKVADDMAAEYGLKSEWDGDTLHFSRSGVSGRVDVTDTHMDVAMTLGFLFKPFAGKFRDTMSANFDKLLADGKGGKGPKPAKPKKA